jgi:hypothetical protein
MVPSAQRFQKSVQCGKDCLGDRCSSGFRESVDFVLKASGYSDIDEAIGILWDVIKEIWWGIAGEVCVRSYCLHNNIYPTGRHFRVTSMESIASDMGVGRILHQTIFGQMEVCE